MKKNRKRILYAIAFILLMIIEVCIAVYIRGGFIRNYFGDVLSVMVVYSFVRIFMPEGCRRLPLYVFLFAVGIELTQYFQLVRLLGLENNRVISVVLGGAFDWADILCYGAGCLIIWAAAAAGELRRV